jgi:hypothetical protein
MVRRPPERGHAWDDDDMSDVDGFRVPVGGRQHLGNVVVPWGGGGSLLVFVVTCPCWGGGGGGVPRGGGGIDPNKVLYAATVMRKEG